jgi:hypothetical protein
MKRAFWPRRPQNADSASPALLLELLERGLLDVRPADIDRDYTTCSTAITPPVRIRSACDAIRTVRVKPPDRRAWQSAEDGRSYR